MFDQTSIVRDCTKYTYKMRYPEQGAPLRRLAAQAGPVQSAPRGQQTQQRRRSTQQEKDEVGGVHRLGISVHGGAGTPGCSP